MAEAQNQNLQSAQVIAKIFGISATDVENLRNNFPVKKDRQVELYKSIL